MNKFQIIISMPFFIYGYLVSWIVNSFLGGFLAYLSTVEPTQSVDKE
jgi:hypothetical protein